MSDLATIAAVGDVIQCDPEHCRWGAVFVIVEDVKAWGVRGYFFSHGNEPAGPAYIRVEHGKYAVIGAAEWRTA